MRRPAGAVVLGVVGVLGVAALAWPYTVDDAFIVARYAQNVATGHGYAMNPDVPSDGITGPLWIIPPLLAVWLSGDPVLAAKLAGGACAALAAWRVVRWAGRRALGRCARWASALVLACLPDVGTWAVAGLETGAALLALTALAEALLGRVHARFGAAAIATTAIAWLRPDLAPCVLVLWLGAWSRHGKRALGWLAVAALAASSVVVFRLALFDHAWPLSASAKPADLGHGVDYVLRALMLSGGGILAAVSMRTRREDRWLAAALCAHLLAVALAGGDWMPGARLIVPVLGLYALLVGRAFARVGLTRPRLAIACFAGMLLVPLADLAVRVPELHANAAQRERAQRLARQLARAGQTVALLDAGYLAYASGVPVVDLGGLTDPHVARLPGGHVDKRIDEDYLRRRAPGLILLHSSVPPEVSDDQRLLAFSGYPVERRVAAMPWVRESFRVAGFFELNSSYGYVVLERAVSPVR